MFPRPNARRCFATFSCLLCKKPKSIQAFRRCRISRGCQYPFGRSKGSCFLVVLPVKWVAPNFYHEFANMPGRFYVRWKLPCWEIWQTFLNFMRKRCEGYRNQSSALPSRASCSRCFLALNLIVPIRKRKDKNLALSAIFLRLGAAAISLNADIGSKVQQINCWEAFFRLLRVGEDCQSKKSCRKGEIFVFKTSG